MGASSAGLGWALGGSGGLRRARTSSNKVKDRKALPLDIIIQIKNLWLTLPDQGEQEKQKKNVKSFGMNTLF